MVEGTLFLSYSVFDCVIHPWGIFFLVLNLNGMFLCIAFLIPSLNCDDQSSIADLLTFTGDVIISLISYN